MIEDICLWLPKIITLEMFKGIWEEYNNELYKIFIRDFIINKLYFKNKKVVVRANPKYKNYEHAFIHLTTTSIPNAKDINDRLPDLKRCERLEWNRKIIENYECKNNCPTCKKILYYEEYYKNNIRISLLFPDVRFKVVLEERKDYFLLITGYYINYDYRLNKELKKANLYSKQKTPLV